MARCGGAASRRLAPMRGGHEGASQDPEQDRVLDFSMRRLCRGPRRQRRLSRSQAPVRRHDSSVLGSGCEGPLGAIGFSRLRSESISLITVELIRALNHPVRREALRLLHGAPDGEMSVTEMSHFMTESRQAVNQQVKVLLSARAVSIRAIRLVRNVKEKRYESLVSDTPTLVALLAETEEEDASIRVG
jgi:DNA-binding transcriptional ArsR family regulator